MALKPINLVTIYQDDISILPLESDSRMKIQKKVILLYFEVILILWQRHQSKRVFFAKSLFQFFSRKNV